MNWNTLTPDVLKSAAEGETGLQDFGSDDEYWEIGLQKLIDSLRKEAYLNEYGKEVFYGWLKRRLITRLRLQERLSRPPNLDAARPERPMFVVGFPRTGTTLLYNLLACDPGTHSPELWQLLDPAPPPYESSPSNVKDRIDACQMILDKIDERTPVARTIHYFGSARAREECHFLLAPSLRAPVVLAMAHVPKYAEWLYGLSASQLLPGYRSYAHLLAMLGRGHEDKRWLSKSTLSCWFVSSLLEVFPNAWLVRTHRNPVDAIPSMCNLYQVSRSRHTDHNRPANEMGRLIESLYKLYLERFEEARIHAHAPTIQDVHYDSLVADPVGTIERVYGNFGIPLTREHVSKMEEWLVENPYDPGRFPPRKHIPEEFGLDRSTLEQLDR